jgi:hypothetical protein
MLMLVDNWSLVINFFSYKNSYYFRFPASASQTLLSSESLNEESNDEIKLNKNSFSPTHQLTNMFRALTKSSDVNKQKKNIYSNFKNICFLAINKRYSTTTTTQTAEISSLNIS